MYAIQLYVRASLPTFSSTLSTQLPTISDTITAHLLDISHRAVPAHTLSVLHARSLCRLGIPTWGLLAVDYLGFTRWRLCVITQFELASTCTSLSQGYCTLQYKAPLA